MKRCRKCGIEKDEIEFHRDKNNKDGLCTQCKQCKRVSSHLYVVANKDKVAENNRLRGIKNKDKIAEKKRLKNTQKVNNAATDTPNFRTLKVCPPCRSRDIHRRKNMRGYYCQTCKTSFFAPSTEQAVDNRNGLSIPKCLLAHDKP
jgi:hypothetical protein